MLAMLRTLFSQMLRKPFTNLFPVKYAPKSVNAFLRDVDNGRKKMNPPVAVPPGFRGKIRYHREKCIGCRLCTRVCPANAVVFQERDKKIRYHFFRCTFCGECVKACPVKALEFTDEFLSAAYGKD